MKSIEDLKKDMAIAHNDVDAAHPRGIFGCDFLELFVDRIKELGYTEADLPRFKELRDQEWELMPSRPNVFGKTGTRGPFDGPLGGFDYYDLANVVYNCFNDKKYKYSDEEKLHSNMDLSIFDAAKRAGGDDALFDELFIDNIRFFGYSPEDLALIKEFQARISGSSSLRVIESHGGYRRLSALLIGKFESELWQS